MKNIEYEDITAFIMLGVMFVGIMIMLVATLIPNGGTLIIFDVEYHSKFIVIIGIVTMLLSMLVAVFDKFNIIKSIIIAVGISLLYYLIFSTYFYQLEVLNSFKDGKVLICERKSGLAEVSIENGWKNSSFEYIWQPDGNGWIYTEDCKIK